MAIRITTWNVNGLRAAIRKGFTTHLAAIDPDVLLLQEIRTTPEQLPEPWADPPGWFVSWHPAQRKGYAGTALWTRRPHRIMGRGLDKDDPDLEGRLLRARVDGVQVASIYLPSGSMSDQRQAAKEQWMDRFLPWAAQMQRTRTPAILGGDLNIAHTARDIFYAKSNEKTSGFLPHERHWFDRLLDSGWSDLVRNYFGDIDGPYSWWSNRGQARQLDHGWRIDYLLANHPAVRHFCNATVGRQAGLDCSDHAPVTVELDL